jgi:heme-degrading monooxygenase HmoA
MEMVAFIARPKNDVDPQEYQRTFERMLARVTELPGFVDIRGFAGADGTELALARFTTREAIEEWRDHPEHARTRQRGRDEFFEAYEITIATVWKNYDWSRDAEAGTAEAIGVNG